MARQVRWSPKAAASLEEICTRIGRDSPVYASVFARRVVAVVERLPRFPKLGRVVPEYGDDNLREVIYQRYRIVYRLSPNAIEVVTICHGARDLRGAL